MGTRRNIDVETTSNRRYDANQTSFQRRYCVVCRLGRVTHFTNKINSSVLIQHDVLMLGLVLLLYLSLPLE